MAQLPTFKSCKNRHFWCYFGHFIIGKYSVTWHIGVKSNKMADTGEHRTFFRTIFSLLLFFSCRAALPWCLRYQARVFLYHQPLPDPHPSPQQSLTPKKERNITLQQQTAWTRAKIKKMKKTKSQFEDFSPKSEWRNFFGTEHIWLHSRSKMGFKPPPPIGIAVGTRFRLTRKPILLPDSGGERGNHYFWPAM